MSPTAAGVGEAAEVAGVAVALVGVAAGVAVGVAAAVRPPSLVHESILQSLGAEILSSSV